MKHRRLIDRILLAGLATALSCEPLFAQTRDTPRQPAPPARTSVAGRFIVAFELSPEKGFAFTWPYESMRPAPYESVLMVVESMPRDRRGVALRASESLKVNGRFQRPLSSGRISDRAQQFEVKLSQGRLRFSLLIPDGFALDRQYRTARIKLYETARPNARPAGT